MAILPDVNVWLAMAFQTHVHHESAKAWLAAIESPIFFCRLTQQGLLRIACNPKVFGADAVTLGQAWELYDAFQTDERIAYLDEPADLETKWRQLTENGSTKPNVWSDAYLAAFSIAAGLKVVTFDRDFLRFEGLDANLLT
ncbi:MAG: TA system VapC family ribonuclease toxin [Planctomycetota bacterium]